MLEVANLDVSDETLPCEPTDIAAICYQEFSNMAEHNPNVKYLIELSETPMFISTNARYLTLVIDNILSNAEKFTNNGRIVLECHKDYKRLVLSVTDTGCGIPKDMQTTVFDKFIKLDNDKQGSGLGLYLCQLIVKRLLGKIYIDPEYTGGTRIIVELPVE